MNFSSNAPYLGLLRLLQKNTPRNLEFCAKRCLRILLLSIVLMALHGRSAYAAWAHVDSLYLVNVPSRQFDCSNLLIGYSAPGTLEISTGSSNVYYNTFVGFNYDGNLNLSGGILTTGSEVLIGSGDGSQYFASGTLTISGGTMTDLNGKIGTVAGCNGVATVTGGSWENANALIVGRSANGVLNILGGTVSQAYASVGFGYGSSGNVVVAGGTWASTQYISIGDYTSGTMSLLGGNVSSSGGYIGYGNGSNGTVTVFSGSWNNAGDLAIGEQGTGTLQIFNGNVADVNGYIGNGAGASGIAIINGGSWTNSQLVVGESGNGTMTVMGGNVSSSNAFIGGNASGSGLVTVSSGSWNNTNSISVGHSGSGSLVITGGGIGSSNVLVGGDNHSSGVMAVSGGVSTITNDLILGYSGTGALNVSNGTLMSIFSYAGYNPGGVGNINMSGGQWGSALLYVGYGGSGNIDLSAGRVLSLSQIVIGGNSNSSGNISVSGSGVLELKSSLTQVDIAGVFALAQIYDYTTTLPRALIVGDYGTGTLSLAGRGIINSDYAIIGAEASGNGAVTVTGGTWTNIYDSIIGDQGTGTLSISGSGVVSNGNGTIGNQAGASGTVTISGGTWINSQLVIGGAGNGVMNISGGSVSSSNAYISAGASGNGAVTVTGGTWNNSGNLTIGDQGTGTLSISGSGLVSNGNGTIGNQANSNGTATVSSGTWMNLGNLLVGKSGTGTLNMSGSGIVTVGSGSGTLTLASGTGSVGTLNIGGASPAIGTTSGTLNVAQIVGGSGIATVNFNQSDYFSLAASLSGSLTLNQLGSGTTAIAGISSFSGTITADNGQLNLPGSVTDTMGMIGSFGAANGSVAVTGTWTHSADLYVANSGTGTLAINGGNVANNNGYIGELQGSSGTATVTSGSWANSGKLVVGDRGTGALILSGGVVASSTGVIGAQAGASGNVTVTSGTWINTRDLAVGNSGTGTLNLSGSGVVSVGGTLTLGSQAGSAGTLNLGTGATAGTLIASVVTGGSGAATVNFNHSGDYTFASSLQGSLSVNQLGSGTTLLTGSNSYNGGTTIYNGTLRVGHSSALGAASSALVIHAGALDVYGQNLTIGSLSGSAGAVITNGTANAATFTVDQNIATTYAGTIQDGSGTVALTKSGSGTLVLTGTNNYSGSTMLGDGTLQIGDGGNTGTLGTGSVMDNARLVFNRGNLLTVSNGISGSGSVIQSGSGTLVLTGSNSYSGGTTLNAGQLNLSNASALGTGVFTINGGVIDNTTGGAMALAGNNAQNWNGPFTFIGSNALDLGTGAVTLGTNSMVSVNANTLTVGGAIGDGGNGYSVTKSGSGTLILTGSNSFSGSTTVLGGTLRAGAAGVVSSQSNLRVSSGATFDLNNFNQSVGSLGGVPAINLFGPGWITYVPPLPDPCNDRGAVTLGSATLTVGSDNTSKTFMGVISGSGGVTKVGTGMWTLYGANTYSGPTTISGGTLCPLSENAIPNQSALTIDSAGTLLLKNVGRPEGWYYENLSELDGCNQSIGSLSGSGSVILGSAILTTGNDNTSTTFSGGISDIGGITKTGTGTWTLTGSNSYSGVTTISNGTLQIGDGGNTGTLGTGLVMNDATLVFNRGNLLTVSNAISGSGSVIQSGSGTTVLTGSNSYSGITNIHSGTLEVAAGGSIGSLNTILVGDASGDNGVFLLSGGNVSNSESIIGNQVGSSGTATVTSGSWAHSGDLTVAHSGAGTLAINGGTVTDEHGYIGRLADSNGTALISSGTWANSGNLFVGTFGTGALTIIGGAATNATGVIGYGSASNGTVTVSGGTWANSGDFAVGGYGTGSLTLSSGAITNTHGYIGMWASSNGTATVSGGTWANSGNLTVGAGGTGTLLINGGNVSNAGGVIGGLAGSSGNVAVSSGTWTNSGDLIVGASGTGVLTINGGGVVSVGSGTGTLTLAAQAGSSGTLNLGSGAAAGSLNAAVITGGSGTAVVNFNHSGYYTHAPQLTGNLSINILGSGTTNLGGSLSYSGSTVIQNGALLVNGSIASHVTVANGGILGGSGTVFNGVTNKGIVSPGNSPGTLTIAGDYTQTSAGSLLIQIASSAVYDKLVIGGAATLGGTLEIALPNGFVPKRGETFSFITAASGLSGTFSAIKTDTPFKLNLIYGSSGVTIISTQGLFADLERLTPNQLAVAKGLDKITEDPRASHLMDYLNNISASFLPQTLERIVPTDLIPMFDASIAMAQTQAFNLERRMEEIRGGATGFSATGLNLSDSHGTRSCNGSADARQCIGKDGKALEPAPISDRWGFFINGSGEFVDEESTAIARGTDFSTGGITTGADYRLGDHAAAGLTAGYANTSGNGRANGAVKMDSGKMGLYATVFDRGFFLNGAVGGGLTSYDTQRDTLGGTARGDANGKDFNALLGTGYTSRRGGFSVGPIASLRYSWVGIDSFMERGSLAPLRISAQSEASLKSTAGLQASYAFGLGKIGITPQLRAQWQHEYLNTARGIGASFLPGGAFTVNGPEIGHDSLLLDAGATIQLTPTIGIYAFYTGDLGRSNYTSHLINGGVQWSF